MMTTVAREVVWQLSFVSYGVLLVRRRPKLVSSQPVAEGGGS